MRAARSAALESSRIRKLFNVTHDLSRREGCEAAAAHHKVGASPSSENGNLFKAPEDLTFSLRAVGARTRSSGEASTSCSSACWGQRRGFASYGGSTAAELVEEPTPVFKVGPLAAYYRLVEKGTLSPGDTYQEEVLAALQALYDVLVTSHGHSRPGHVGSFWSRLLSGSHIQNAGERGLYMWGGVGTGKTMLMDIFYEELPSSFSKRRIHFHDMMLSVHARLQKFKGSRDPLEQVAQEMSDEASILCLDEFMVTDVADAMILTRLFKHLFNKGTVLLSTSNRPPERLYEGGLQRDLFLPFIALLKERCVVHEIRSSTDYRRLTAVQEGLYFVGVNASALLNEKLAMLTDGVPCLPTSVELMMARTLQVPKAADGTAYFEFHELCEMPLGAADYFGLCKHFHTIVLNGIPRFGASNRSAAYRFVTLVDVMYENKAKFVCAAEADPFELFRNVVTIGDAPKKTSSRSSRSEDADVAVDNELGFAKERTMSRLTEMQSAEYDAHHREAYKEMLQSRRQARCTSYVHS